MSVFYGILPVLLEEGSQKRKPWPREAKGLVQGHKRVHGKARAQAWLCGNSRLKAESMSEGPGTPGARPQPLLCNSWPIPSAASGEACWVCTLQNFRANGPCISFYESQPILFHFPIIFSTAFYIVTWLFKSKDLTREYKNIPKPTEWHSLEV